jgi:hypothetical protein
MIDLTSKDINVINAQIQKYANVVQLFKPEEQPYFAYIISTGTDYVKEKYPEIPKNIKTWAIMTLVKRVINVYSDSDIKTIIDAFVVHYKYYYNDFGNDLVWASDYDKEYKFVREYVNKKG